MGKPKSSPFCLKGGGEKVPRFGSVCFRSRQATCSIGFQLFNNREVPDKIFQRHRNRDCEAPEKHLISLRWNQIPDPRCLFPEAQLSALCTPPALKPHRRLVRLAAISTSFLTSFLLYHSAPIDVCSQVCGRCESFNHIHVPTNPLETKVNVGRYLSDGAPA